MYAYPFHLYISKMQQCYGSKECCTIVKGCISVYKNKLQGLNKENNKN